MAETGAKQIKIAFGVDSASAERTKRFILEITQAVNQLAVTTNRAFQQLTGGSSSIGLPKLGGAMSVSNNRPIGTVGGGGQVNIRGGSGGILGGVANTFVAGATALRTAVTGTQQSFQTVSSGLKTFVDKADQDINRLNRSVEKLSKTLSGLGPNVPGGGGFGGGPSGNSGLFTADEFRSAGFSRGAAKRAYLNQFAPEELGSVGRSSGLGMSERVFGKGGLGGFVGGKVEGLAVRAGLPAGLAGSLGGFASAAAVPVGLGLAAAAIYEFGAKSFENERKGQIGYTLNEPFQRMSRRAAVAQPFVQQFNAVQSGDIASQVAFQKALERRDVRQSLDNVVLRKEQVEMMFSKLALSSMAKQGLMELQSYAAQGYGKAMEWVTDSKLPEADKRHMRELMRDQALRNMPVEQAQQLQQAAQDERAIMNPRTSSLLNSVYGGAMGRVKSMRAAGLSAGYTTRAGYAVGSRYEDLQARLTGAGYDIGDYASGYQQLLGIGRGYGRAVGPIGLVSTGIAGLSNAADLTRIGGILGGSVGAGGRFLHNTVQGSIGAGGLDVAVGRDLFGGVGQSLLGSGQLGAGNTAATYMAAMAGLVGGGIGAPLDVAEQQRRMAMIQSGTGNFGAFSTGSKAPLYQATSLLGSISSMGGYGAGAEGLMRMSPELISSIYRGGEIPEWAKGLGIDRGQVENFARYQRRSPLFEVMDKLVTGPAAGLLGDVRQAEAGGGDFMDVFRSKTEGLAPADRARAAMKMSEQLGGVLFSQGLASTPEEGAGTFLNQLSQDTTFAPYLKGKGVGAAGPKGAEAAALADQAERIANASTEIAGSVKKFVDAGAFRSANVENAAIAGVRGAAQGQVEPVDFAVGDLIGALTRFSASLNASTQRSGIVKRK